jgi:hypothetical protein
VNATLAVMGLLAGAFFFRLSRLVCKKQDGVAVSATMCLIVVVLTHIAEMFDLFPSMGWGLPNSVGHYLDFVSAVLALTLLPLGILADAITRRKNSNLG